MRVELDFHRGQGRRLEGTLRSAQFVEQRPFVGTIQLLRLLEQIADEEAVIRGGASDSE